MNNSLIKQIEDFKDYTVLIIGDVMIDSYMWGKVERISPETPVPIVSISNKENRLGGAANVALNITSLGAKAIICGLVGDDIFGKWFIERCTLKNIDSKGIVVDKSRPTTIKTRVISNNQHLIRVDEETSLYANKEIQQQLLNKIYEIINSNTINAIIFEDYDKGVISKDLIEATVKLAKQKNIIITVDPKHRNFNDYKGVSLFKPNFKELCQGLNINFDLSNPENLFNAIKTMHTENNIEIVMVTLSEKGIFISNGNTYNLIPSKVRDVADVSGAGDTVISTATLCLCSGMTISEIADISNIAAGIVCEKIGVVPIEKETLINHFIK